MTSSQSGKIDILIFGGLVYPNALKHYQRHLDQVPVYWYRRVEHSFDA